MCLDLVITTSETDGGRIYFKSVKTIAALRDSDWMEPQPYTGVINSAENLVYFSSVEGYGHFVMKMEIPDGKVENAELVTAGPSLISSLELTPDEKHILLADVDAKALVEVNLSDGEQKFLAEGSDDSYPGVWKTCLSFVSPS